MLVRWRRTCRAVHSVIAVELRNRYYAILGYFLYDVGKLDFYMQITGAVVSGSAALRFFLHDEPWHAADMDIYVPNSTYPQFIAAVTAPEGLAFQYIPRRERHISASLEDSVSPALISEVRRYRTREGKHVDIVRCASDSPLPSLHAFWSTLVHNFIGPHGCGCGFPTLTFSRRGLLKAGFRTTSDQRAMTKYENRGFSFFRDDWFDHLEDVVALDHRFFGESQAIVLPYGPSASIRSNELRLSHNRRGWEIEDWSGGDDTEVCICLSPLLFTHPFNA